MIIGNGFCIEWVVNHAQNPSRPGLCPPPMEEGGAAPHSAPTKTGLARRPSLAAVVAAAGCKRDSGLPSQVTSHHHLQSFHSRLHIIRKNLEKDVQHLKSIEWTSDCGSFRMDFGVKVRESMDDGSF